MEQKPDNVPAINTRLLQIREALQLNQEGFASLLSISRPFLSNIEKGRNKVPFDVVTFLIEAKHVSAHWFHTGNGTMFEDLSREKGQVNGQVNGQVSEKDKINPTKSPDHSTKNVEPIVEVIVEENQKNKTNPALKPLQLTRTEIIVATQDTTGNPTYSVINHKAAANYLSGYQSQEYYEQLGVVTLPRALVGTKKQGVFLQIEGDSMTPKFQHGDWVACTLLDRSEWHTVHDLDCYVVVSSTYGIQFKRVKNRLESMGFLRWNSENRRHRSYNIEEENLLQLFRFVLHISPDASNSEDSLYQKVDHLEDTTTDLRVMFEHMQEQLDALRGTPIATKNPKKSPLNAD